MANVWRDFMFTESIWLLRWRWPWWWRNDKLCENFSDPNPVDYASSKSTAFAWQAGGGLIYELSDQVTFDVSYRWYQLGNLSS